MRSFHPKLKVDLGRGPGKGLGPRMFVGLASAAPLPLTAAQASKIGVEISFDVDLNPAQVIKLCKISHAECGTFEIPGMSQVENGCTQAFLRVISPGIT